MWTICKNAQFQQNLGEITVLYAVKDFFHNRENKEDLINLATIIFQSDEGKRHLQCPLIINSRDKTWKVSSSNTEPLQKCNHDQ